MAKRVIWSVFIVAAALAVGYTLVPFELGPQTTCSSAVSSFRDEATPRPDSIAEQLTGPGPRPTLCAEAARNRLWLAGAVVLFSLAVTVALLLIWPKTVAIALQNRPDSEPDPAESISPRDR